MKKIPHISKFYYPYYGGIEDVAKTIVHELEPYYEQKVIYFNHERGTVFNINGVDVLRINAPITCFSQPISLGYRAKLQKLINKFRPDFIHLHLPNPLIATMVLTLKLHGAKIISHWHADILGQQLIYPFYKYFEKKLLEKSYKIIATSEMYLNASTPLANFKDKTTVLPNTVNEDKFKLFEGEMVKVEKIRETYGHKKIVFFVGRHVSYKGIQYLIEAEKHIKEDCVIVIAGTGMLNRSLKNLASDCERIKFVGRLSDTEMKYYMYASSVFAFPSISRQEAFGVALAEALFCGLPAVSFNVEGSGALWVNKNGYTGLVVENKNPLKYAEAVSKLLTDEDLRKQFSNNAKLWVKENFLKDQIVKTMSNVYD